MKIYIATDHAGFELKEKIKSYLTALDYEIYDLGNLAFDQQDDYPDFIIPCAEKVANDPNSLGIVFGKTGNGEAIAANKVKGIRAAVCTEFRMAELARSHNMANVLALGSEYVDFENAKEIVEIFIDTELSKEERHNRRVNKIISYESS